MDVIAAIWAWLASYPVELATGSINLVLGGYVLIALLIVFWRRHPEVSIVQLMTPLALYGVAWGLSWLATTEPVTGSELASWLWLVFSILMLTSLIWTVVNLIKVLTNKS